MFLFFWRGKTKQNNKIRMIFEPCWLYTHTHTVVINDPPQYSLTSKCQKKDFVKEGIRYQTSMMVVGGWWCFFFFYWCDLNKNFESKKWRPNYHFIRNCLHFLPSCYLWTGRKNKKKYSFHIYSVCLCSI